MQQTKGYGRKGQEWHADFIKYMEFIASHEAYRGMPDAVRDNGLIQWEAPSNRRSGRFKDTHHRRRDWWRNKASAIGVNTSTSKWISRTAKLIHPTKWKPCKRCGRVMALRYMYPQKRLFDRISRLDYVGDDFAFDPFETISDLITRLVGQFDERVLSDLPGILKTSAISPPTSLGTLEDWLRWIEEQYVPLEPGLLSPGAMSNAPDRFEGFHSFNLCCRSAADTGRWRQNLATYATDRRVFENWNDGDWVAANRLIGAIRTKLRTERCQCGHLGPCSADHIGPLSLGFTHRAEFQLLCTSCNSAKHNRFTLRDVGLLLAAEDRGDEVASWYCRSLWDARKGSVVDNETALRLSKMLRDNRHTVMAVLDRIRASGNMVFLAAFLQLQYADRDVGFTNLRAERYITRFDTLTTKNQPISNAAEQKARRCRVAFEALRDYYAKTGSNAFVVSTPEIDQAVDDAIAILGHAPTSIKALDEQIGDLLLPENRDSADEGFRQIVGQIPSHQVVECFIAARSILEAAVRLTADELSKMWDSDRYVRAGADIQPESEFQEAIDTNLSS